MYELTYRPVLNHLCIPHVKVHAGDECHSYVRVTVNPRRTGTNHMLTVASSLEDDQLAVSAPQLCCHIGWFLAQLSCLG